MKNPGPTREVTEVRTPGRNWAVAGITSGALAFVFVPVFLGPLGILFGVIGLSKGARKLGKIAIAVSVSSLVVGSAIYVLLQNLMNL